MSKAPVGVGCRRKPKAIGKRVLCVGCGQTWQSEQSYGLHLWQARRRGTKCSPDVEVERLKLEQQFDRLLDENARIVAALRKLTGYRKGVVIEQLVFERWTVRFKDDVTWNRCEGRGSSLRIALERCVKAVRRGGA